MRYFLFVLFAVLLGCGAPAPIDSESQRIDPKEIMEGSFQYLGDGIVTFTLESGDVWVYIPGKGERNVDTISKAELSDILRRLDEKVEQLKKLQKIHEDSTGSLQTAARTPPGGLIFSRNTVCPAADLTKASS